MLGSGGRKPSVGVSSTKTFLRTIVKSVQVSKSVNMMVGLSTSDLNDKKYLCNRITDNI